MLKLMNVDKQYGRGTELVRALSAVCLTFKPGEFVVLTGASGSGKSTVLKLLGALDFPTAGEVLFQGGSLSGQNDRFLSEYRRCHVGFVFQSFHLVPTLTALENAALPLLIAGTKTSEALARAGAALARVGLESRAKHRPSELSGGQMQRVAVARALVANPQVILADEPTGNLDTVSGLEILQLLKQAQTDLNRLVVMVTHDPRAIPFGTRHIELSDGRVVRDERVEGSDDSTTAVGELPIPRT